MLPSRFPRDLTTGRFSPTDRMRWPSRFFFPLPAYLLSTHSLPIRGSPAACVAKAMIVPRISVGATVACPATAVAVCSQL
jgi:hypothetical protein